MRKRIVACAAGVLALTYSANLWAQSQVTMYGLIDTRVEYLNNTPKDSGGKTSKFHMTDSGLQGPRLGFRGAEDLGGGFKAVFTLEHGFRSTDGRQADPNRMFNRQAFVGFQSKHHRLRFGRQYTSIFDTLLFITPLTYAGSYEPFSPLLGNLRLDNTVKYTFTMNGWKAQVNYSIRDRNAGKRGNNSWGGFLNYTNHGWNVSVAVDNQNGDTNELTGGHSKSRKVALAGSYQLNPALRLSTGYRWGEIKSDTGIISLRDDFWWLGFNYKFDSPLLLKVGYYQNNIKKREGVGHQPTGRQISVQGIYSLSKRTDLYAAAAYARNAAINLGPTSRLGGNAKSQTGVSIGMRHRF